MSHKTLSFLGAILINVNVVVGSAFFLGAGTIAHSCGVWAPGVWLVCGLLLVPLAAALVYFAKRYPEAGGIYWYCEKTLGSWWGFISAWGYFVGTAAGNAAVLKAFTGALQSIPVFAQGMHFLSKIGIESTVLCVLLFAWISCSNISLFERMQVGFTFFKLIPLLVIVLGALFLGGAGNIPQMPFNAMHFFGAIPVVLFAYIGIEACSAVIDKINNPERNGFRVLLISFSTIVALYTFLQACIIVMPRVNGVSPFLSIIPALTNNPVIATWGNALISAAITASFLGGFYGMFYFNNWILYSIGKDKSFIGSSYLTRLNAQGAPWVCVVSQSVLIILLFYLVQHDDHLFVMSDFGVGIAYLLTAYAYFWASKKKSALAAIASCLLLLILAVRNLVLSSPWNILPFVLILVFGIVGYLARKRLV